MHYRQLGKTGLRVSEVGFGCGNVGGLLVRGPEREQVEGVRRALALGFNYFDTAPSYGDGQSEASLGRVLRELRPQAWVATKVHVRGADLKDIRGSVRRSLEESLKRLGRDSVDVFQLHTSVAQERGGGVRSEALGLRDVLGKGGVADAFDHLRSEHLVGFLGFTGNGETEALHQLVDSGRFDLLQAYCNMLNPSAGWDVPAGFAAHNFRRLIDRAAGRGMGVVVIRVLAAGALGGPEARQGYASPDVGGAMATGGDYGSDQERAGALRFLAQGDVKSLPQAAVRFALMHPGVSMVLVGFSSLAQIEEAAACSGQGPLPPAAVERLRHLWATDFGRREAARS